MRFFKITSSLFTGLCLMFFAAITPAQAEFFIGADATTLGAELQFTEGSFLYNLAPYRAKLGYRGETLGFEIHALSNQDKTIGTYVGSDYNFKIENNVGAYIHLREKWVYARLGGTWLQTTFTHVPTNTSDSDTVFLLTGALGVELRLGKHLFFNLDYTYSEGKGHYPNLVGGTSKPTITMQGFGAGVNLAF